ncbi:hypothetical protein IRJ34_17820 [Paenarthrobacter sp. GOM3]|uniref:hypothetical protein n=1 Tax=Paenarthrobacter sp. GOM3 TaxID=2782567 RepID=UPI001BA477DF|nr:hypothetical protein [Paenarthrobacter sp. GOM3]WOH18190.1 hypothetical protein IRJ34_17820 [Paenarthrobacter sp. GOM3]
MEFSGYVPPDEFWAMNDRLDQEVRNGAEALPLFRITGWEGPAMLGGWQLDNSEGSVSHGDPSPGSQAQYIEVVTTTQDPYAAARNRWVVTAGIPHSRDELQASQAAFAALDPEAQEIAVDGIPTNFSVWRGYASWLAAGTVAGYGIVIDAQRRPPEPEAVSLTRVPDVEPLLQARRAAIKALRGEN